MSALTETASVLARTLHEYKVFRIQANDSNKFALVVDPIADNTSFINVIEIFDVGGRTPPNTHQVANEGFYVLHGEGLAIAGEQRIKLKKGDSFLVRAGQEHVVENTGPTRLYCLTTMVPNEAFAELIRAGVPDHLDREDLVVLEG
jgi:mannose-6-phosphate isomerase-like protein (cupin superfamily)